MQARGWSIAGGLTIFGWLAFIWAWAPAPLALTTDDAHYYFVIARRVADGRAPTFDGFEPTNGFHPLWLGVLAAAAPLERLVSPTAFVRLVLTAQVGLVAFGARLMERGTGIRVTRTLVVLALVAPIAKVLVNGLESALSFMLLGAALELSRRVLEPRPQRPWGALGAVLAALVLARVTNALLVALLVYVVVHRKGPSRAELLRLAFAFVPPLSTWATYSWTTFGHVMPISAAVKTLRTPPAAFLGAALALALGVAFVVARERRARASPFYLAPLVASVAVEAIADAATRHVLVPEVWHLVPHLTLAVLVVTPRLSRPRVRFAFAVASVVAAAVTWPRRLAPASYAAYEEARRTGLWLDANLTRDARVGSWDAGIVAFYARRPVTNLGGHVASWRFKERYLDRDDVASFVDEAKIDVLTQYAGVGELSSSTFAGVDLERWRLVRDAPFTFGSWLGGGPRSYRYLVFVRDPRALRAP